MAGKEPNPLQIGTELAETKRRAVEFAKLHARATALFEKTHRAVHKSLHAIERSKERLAIMNGGSHRPDYTADDDGAPK